MLWDVDVRYRIILQIILVYHVIISVCYAIESNVSVLFYAYYRICLPIYPMLLCNFLLSFQLLLSHALPFPIKNTVDIEIYLHKRDFHSDQPWRKIYPWKQANVLWIHRISVKLYQVILCNTMWLVYLPSVNVVNPMDYSDYYCMVLIIFEFSLLRYNFLLQCQSNY